jgi:hypothetical protein
LKSSASASAVEGRRPKGPFLGLVNPQGPTCKVLAVQGLYGLGGIFLRLELNKGETPLATGCSVKRHVDIGNWPYGAEELDQIFARDVKTQISGKNFS